MPSGGRVGPVRTVRGLVAGTAVLMSLLSASTASAVEANLGTAGGVTYIVETVAATGPSNLNSLISCPSETTVSGGGFSSSALLGQAFSLAPDDTDGTGWNGIIGLPSGSQDLSSYAICSEGKFTYKGSRLAELEAVGTKSAKAACPGSKHVVGGGAYLSGTILDSFINSTYPVDSKDKGKAPDDGWKVRIRHTDPGSVDFRAFAICQKGNPAYHKDSAELGPGTSSGITVGCKGNEHLLGMGGKLNGQADDALVRVLRPSDDGDADSVPDDSALVNGHNTSAATESKTLKAWAICD